MGMGGRGEGLGIRAWGGGGIRCSCMGAEKEESVAAPFHHTAQKPQIHQWL